MSFEKESSILDGWIFNGKVSRKNLAFLEQEFQQGLEVIPEASGLSIAGGLYCAELDLPTGSYWIQAIASLLDHLRPVTEEMPRLAELNKQLIYFGHLKEEH